jgi:hypothetical protein
MNPIGPADAKDPRYHLALPGDNWPQHAVYIDPADGGRYVKGSGVTGPFWYRTN